MSRCLPLIGAIGCVGTFLACSSTGPSGSTTSSSSSSGSGSSTGNVIVGTGSSTGGTTTGTGATGSSGGSTTGTTGASNGTGGGTTTGAASGGCTTGATYTPADDAGLPPGDCSDSGWCVHSPQPSYTGVWWFGANDIWAVQGNAVRHWDGAKWTIVFGGLTPYINDAGAQVGGDVPTLGGIWGSSDSDIWVGVSNTGGEFFHWDGAHWSTVSAADFFYYPVLWGAAANDIWAGGNELSHWNGCVWSSAGNPVPPGDLVSAIWGSSSTDVWAVGQGGSTGLILHWDGVSWVRATNPTGVDAGFNPRNAELSGVWGSGPKDVWAVGDDQTGQTYGSILHYDGTSWQSASVPAVTGPALPSSLDSVWGSGATDVWALGGHLVGGQASVLLHYDGVSWAVAPNPFSGSDTPREFVVGWGSGPSDVYVFGAVGTIVHYDGSAWSSVIAATGDDLSGVWGAASNDVWAASTISGSGGGALYHWNGAAWSAQYVTDGGHPYFQSVSGSGASDVWIASSNGGAWRWDGASWTFVGGGITPGTYTPGVWVESASNRWLVGSLGHVYQNVGNGGWTGVANPADATDGGFLGGSGQLNAVWGISGGPVYAVGTSHYADGGLYNTILRGQASGGALLDVSQPEGNPLTTFSSLNAVGGTSAQDLWAVGNVIYHYVSGTWTEVTPPTSVAGSDYTGVWGAAANDVWIVGSNGSNGSVLLHWDGSQLTPATYPHHFVGLGAAAIYGFASHDIWFVGRNGAIEHFE